ncbi:MAG: hypothetical protein AB2L20_07590 [Mangrovibacterium sp.]
MILERLGFTPETIGLFRGYFTETSAGEVVFPGFALDELPDPGPARVFPDGGVRIPPEFFLEFRQDGLPARRVYVFVSVLELMVFYQFRPVSGSILVAVGSAPGYEWLKRIRSRYGRVKFILVGGHSFFDRLWDIRMACCLDGHVPFIRLEKGKVCIRAGKYQAETDPGALSLSRFCRQSGFRTSVRTLKPKGYPSFFDCGRKLPVHGPD